MKFLFVSLFCVLGNSFACKCLKSLKTKSFYTLTYEGFPQCFKCLSHIPEFKSKSLSASFSASLSLSLSLSLSRLSLSLSTFSASVSASVSISQPLSPPPSLPLSASLFSALSFTTHSNSFRDCSECKRS